MISAAGLQQVYSVEDIVTGECKEVHVARMIAPADESPVVIAEVPGGVDNAKIVRKFQTEAIQAEQISAGRGTEWVAQVLWAGLDGSEMTLEVVANLYQYESTKFGETMAHGEAHGGFLQCTAAKYGTNV